MTKDKAPVIAQVANQYRAVAHMARVLADCHTAFIPAIEAGHFPATIDFMGQRTAWLMETLGDVLNGMDAVCEDDAWIDPIMEEAQRRWPTPSPIEQRKGGSI